MSQAHFPDRLDLLETLLTLAQKKGADRADALAAEGQSNSYSWRDGQIEDATGNEGSEIGLRVFIGPQQALAASSDFSMAGLEALVDRTVAMARAVPPDPYCGLAPKDRLFSGPQADLDILDAEPWSPDELLALAAQSDEAARSVAGVTNTDGGGAACGQSQITLATSDGFAESVRSSSFTISVSAHAEKNGAMERDYDYSSARHKGDIIAPDLIGKEAGNKAVKRLGSRKIASGQMPVVFDPRVATSLLGHLQSAISGGAIALGTSFLREKRGEQIFKDGITLVDDPFRKRGLRSKPFDGEGVSVAPCRIIDNGVLTNWLMNSAHARQLGEEVTGHATRGTSAPPGVGLTNFYMEAGDLSPEDLMSDIADGLYVTELIGMGVNDVTGDYSRGAAGFRIKNGQLDHSTSEITIAGNLVDMFKQLTPADDLVFRYGSNCPTVRIDGMTIAGV